MLVLLVLETRDITAAWKGDAVTPSTLEVTASVPANSHEGIWVHIYSPAQRPGRVWGTSAYTLTLLPLRVGQQYQGTAAASKNWDVHIQAQTCGGFVLNSVTYQRHTCSQFLRYLAPSLTLSHPCGSQRERQ